MAPVVQALAAAPEIDSRIVVTGQHDAMLKQVLGLFAIVPDRNLAVMTANQTLNQLSERLLARLDPILAYFRPDRVLVHGDTTTAMVTALAAFHRQIPVGHVEAGLRTYDVSRPWPEEMNRRVVDVVSDTLFAPTARCRTNLAAERLNGRIVVTGNTVIDALMATVARIEGDVRLRERFAADLPRLTPERRLILVTGHRRENFGAGFSAICDAIGRLAERRDVEVVFPVHLNPNVHEVVHARLGERANVHLVAPLDYGHFVYLMTRADVILTDSGGVQEEAPSLGKPVLVMREVTERPEALEAGTVALVGTDADSIVAAASELLDSDQARHRFAARDNPYGDGHAAERIVDCLLGRPVDEFRSSMRSPRREPIGLAG